MRIKSSAALLVAIIFSFRSCNSLLKGREHSDAAGKGLPFNPLPVNLFRPPAAGRFPNTFRQSVRGFTLPLEQPGRRSQVEIEGEHRVAQANHAARSAAEPFRGQGEQRKVFSSDETPPAWRWRSPLARNSPQGWPHSPRAAGLVS